jgi:hypothetical protein
MSRVAQRPQVRQSLPDENLSESTVHLAVLPFLSVGELVNGSSEMVQAH